MSKPAGRPPLHAACGPLLARSSRKGHESVRSSTVTTSLSVAADPPTCRLLDDVCAEKLMVMLLMRSAGRPSSRLPTIMVLPTPTLPTMSVCCDTRTSALPTKRLRTVSTVGTRMRKKGVSSEGLKVPDSLVSHATHVLVLGST